MGNWFLSSAAISTANTTLEGHGSLWQTIGGLALVFGLLILFLKVLGRLNGRASQGETSLLTVWPLGPKREIQVLRLGEMVHFIYRHDGAMVVLKEQTHQEYLATRSMDSQPLGPSTSWLKSVAGRFAIRTGKPATKELPNF